MRDRYWHNMAARIQRAWRNYVRYRNESATRIQRFWRNNKEGIEYAKLRDRGHQLLDGRKERRRFSLLSYRRFMGDYLEVGSRSALGEQIHSVCGIGGMVHFIPFLPGGLFFSAAEPVTFSSRIQLLVSRLGRSSKPSPRYLVLVSSSLLYLAFRRQTLKNLLRRRRRYTSSVM